MSLQPMKQITATIGVGQTFQRLKIKSVVNSKSRQNSRNIVMEIEGSMIDSATRSDRGNKIFASESVGERKRAKERRKKKEGKTRKKRGWRGETGERHNEYECRYRENPRTVRLQPP